MIIAWWQLILIFVIGVMVGIISYRLFTRKDTTETAHTPALEKEFASYQNAVHQHLMQSTELLQNLGADYQHLAEHLRKSIHELGKSTSHGGTIIPHFPDAQLHTKSDATSHVVMPKTYVDTKHDKE